MAHVRIYRGRPPPPPKYAWLSMYVLLNTDLFVLQNSRCLSSLIKPAMFIDQLNIIDIFTEEEIMKHIALHGPVAVAIHANRNFYAYKSGITKNQTHKHTGAQSDIGIKRECPA